MSFERVLSVDDLVGGIWRLNQAATMGMGRTDSEAAFQEFLKRIPSTSNLAAIAGSAGQLNGALDAALPPSSASLLPTAPLSADLANGPTGMPRVSSLDFLARLVTHQPFSPPPPSQHVLNGLKIEPPTSTAPGPLMGGMGPGDAYANNIHVALSQMPVLHASAAAAANPLAAAAAAAAAHHPAVAAAAALQLQGQLGHLQRLTGNPMQSHPRHSTSHNNPSSATSKSDGETNDKSETRRARRMLSNRESARRSRRRKQEHLSKLENELNDIVEEKKAAADRAQSLERRCNSIEEENKRLREENERLRDELRFLRNEFTERKERNGWRRDGSDHDRERDRDRDAPPPNKRSRHADADDEQQPSRQSQPPRGRGGDDDGEGVYAQNSRREGRGGEGRN